MGEQCAGIPEPIPGDRSPGEGIAVGGLGKMLEQGNANGLNEDRGRSLQYTER